MQGRKVAPSAIVQSRYKVGLEPVKHIFHMTGEFWADSAAEDLKWRGLTLWGVDGTTFNVADTELNRDEFGLPGTGRGRSGYPQVRLVALMALRSHLLKEIAFGPCVGKKTGECTLARELWGSVPGNSLLILDRNFLDHALLYHLNADGKDEGVGEKHWLIRTKKTTSYKSVKALAPGDELVELTMRRNVRKNDPSLPKTMTVRAIRYQIKGYRPQTLLTSMLDPELFPAEDMAELYHERWELELGYDEIKTHMLERQEALRSKKPEGVRQEIWGIALAYNLIRKEMLEVGNEAGVSPLRISFRHSLQFIRIFCLVDAWTMSPGNLPKRLAGLRESIHLLILPERRKERRYERHVKIKMSGFKRNTGQASSNDSKSQEKSS